MKVEIEVEELEKVEKYVSVLSSHRLGPDGVWAVHQIKKFLAKHLPNKEAWRPAQIADIDKGLEARLEIWTEEKNGILIGWSEGIWHVRCDDYVLSSSHCKVRVS